VIIFCFDSDKVSTLVGNSNAGFGSGTSSGATLSNPAGMTVDSNGDIYYADLDGHVIGKITSAGLFLFGSLHFCF
jgi:uncharacterized spore protein YtfJ